MCREIGLKKNELTTPLETSWWHELREKLHLVQAEAAAESSALLIVKTSPLPPECTLKLNLEEGLVKPDPSL